VFRSGGAPPPDADVRLRVEAMRGGRVPPSAWSVDRDAVRRAAEEARQLARALGARPGDGDGAAAGILLALAYPDRIAQRRPGGEGRFLLRNGRGATFSDPQPLSAAPYLVAAELAGHGRDSRIFLAAPLEPGEIEAHFGRQIEREDSVAWDDAAGAVRARRRERLGAIVLRESHIADADPELVRAALLDGIRARGLESLPWGKAARQLRERLVFLGAADPEWPDATDAGLLESLDEWLGPHLHGLTSLAEVQRIDVVAVLEGMLGWEQRRRLDAMAPTHVEVPSGSRIPVDYADPAAPVLAVRLQEVFGWTETPRIAGGRVPLTLHLLSPAHRPVQVTRDLASFWRTTYFDVKKDLKGRYPRHYWPDDPLIAEATHRARPRPR
jgi:ATP-dependent helicase HrpB